MRGRICPVTVSHLLLPCRAAWLSAAVHQWQGAAWPTCRYLTWLCGSAAALLCTQTHSSARRDCLAVRDETLEHLELQGVSSHQHIPVTSYRAMTHFNLSLCCSFRRFMHEAAIRHIFTFFSFGLAGLKENGVYSNNSNKTVIS